MNVSISSVRWGATWSREVSPGAGFLRHWLWLVAGLFLLGAAPGWAQATWQSRDIGTATAGTTSEAGGVISISGSGSDIWNGQDGFRYHSIETTRDFDLVVRVRSIANTHGWAKAGIMARQSIDAGSPHATIFASVAHGTAFQWRQFANGASESSTASEDGGPPRWLKLSRRDEGGGSILTGYTSVDGVTWTQTSRQMVGYGPTVLVGLAVTSHVDGVLATAEFDQLALTQPPVAASNLRVTHRGADGQIDLAWNDNSTDETGFIIEGQRERLHEYQKIGEVGANVSAVSLQGLSEGWGYEVRVKAVKGTVGAYSEIILTRTTPEVEISSPTQTANSITVRIVERANFMSPSGGPYALERSTDGSTFVQIASGLRRTGGDVGTLICDYVDQAVTPGTPYTYRARFLDTNGDVGGYATLASPVSATGSPAPAAPSNLVATAFSSSEIRLTWADNSGNETGFEIHRDIGSPSGGLLATVGANATSYQHTGLTPGTTHTYYVRAVNAAGTSTYTTGSMATTPGTPAPASAWRDDDIGTVGAAGGTVPSGTSYTVRGSGEDIWGGFDSFHFYSRPLVGDGEIAVRVTALDNTDGWAKAGIMLRAFSNTSAPYVFIYVNPAFTVAWQHRATVGGEPSFGSAYRWPPAWLKLVRAGNVFTAYYSDNGTNWTLAQTFNLALPAELRAGLAVTSHQRGTVASATFDSLTVQGAGGSTEPPPATPAAPTGLTASVLSPNEVRLTWTDNATNENSYEIYRGLDAGAKSLFATVGANSTTYLDASVMAGRSYAYSVRAVNAAGASGLSNNASATPGEASWATANIGNYGLGGSLATTGGSLSVSGSGEDIWDRADGFFFAHKPLHGDGEIVARIQSLTDTHSWAKAGLMVRESLAPGAKHAFVFMTPHTGAMGHARTATDGTTTMIEGPWWVSAPYWLKLVRQGTAFSAYTSADGATWSLLTTTNIDMGADAYIGLAVTAHDVTKSNVAEFTNVQVVGP